MQSEFTMTLRDLWDVVRHVRSPKHFLSGLTPAVFRKKIILNDKYSDTSGKNAIAHLSDLKNKLKAEAINDRGQVNYSALMNSGILKELEISVAALRTFDPGSLAGDNQRAAFWLNLYNVLAIHGVIRLGIKKSVMEIPSFFGIVAYRVGDHNYSLDEIENGVIRANSLHPASKKRLFKPGDTRIEYSTSKADPRFHAALVCASNSCPPVRFYQADRLDEQLDAASGNWVMGDVKANEELKRIELPITFFYFKDDFGGPRGIREFLLTHSTGKKYQQLTEAVDNDHPFFFARYDWALNRIA